MPSGADNVLTIHTTDGTERFRIDSSGNVKVGSAATISPDGDLFVTGVCTATTLSGAASGLTGALPAISAANLTNIPAANVTGTLPAISGANLTNLAAANLTGTIADARFPATLPAASAANLTSIPAANVTGTLPAISAANLTNIPAANIVGVCTAGLANASGVLAGVTMIDSWVITASFDINGSLDLTSNWARHVAGGSQFGDIGDDMTESSGVFTFPKTGIYMVHHTMSGRADGTGGRSYIGMRQYYSTNSGSSYTNTSSGYSSASSGTDHVMGSGTVYYDVTDVSTHRIKFNVETSSSCKYFGNATNKNMGVVFMRLGDT